MTEEWRQIIGYEGLYEVSNLGSIRRIFRSGRLKLIKGATNKKGYVYVTLFREGSGRSVRVHAIVARTFIGPCPEGMEVNHKDCVKTNNTPSNLEYVSHRDNCIHAARNGLMTRQHHGKSGWHYTRGPFSPEHRKKLSDRRKGSIGTNRKLTFETAQTIRQEYATKQGNTYTIAEKYGVNQRTIWDIIHWRKYIK